MNISSWADFVSNGPYTNQVLEITQSFLTTDNNWIDLGAATINGNGNSITLGSRTTGLFKFAGATFNDLTIDGGNVTLGGFESLYNASNSTITRTNYATFNKCSANNVVLSIYGGGFLCMYATYNGTNTTTFNQCSINNITLARFGGGFCGNYSRNISFNNCYANITIGSATECGTFIGFNGNGVNSLTCCYAVINQISGPAVGGLVGRMIGGTTTVEKCFVIVTNGMSGVYSGGLLGGMTSSVENNTTITVNDCYVYSDISSLSGAFVGYHTYGVNNNININRCYHVGAMNGKSIAGWFTHASRQLNVTDCVIQSTDYNGGTGTITLLRVDTTLIGIINRLPDNTSVGQSSVNGAAGNWISTWVPGPYPLLACFTDLNIWDGSYTSYDSIPLPGSSQQIEAEVSTMCFGTNTLFLTNDGYKMIQDIKHGDVIDGNTIHCVTHSLLGVTNKLVVIGKGALKHEIPCRDLVVTEPHLISFEGKICAAEDLVDNKLIYKMSTNSTYIYHIVLADNKYAFLPVHGLLAETLHPDNPLHQLIMRT